MEKLPQYIRRNSSDYCQKLAANHAGLIYHGGFYYKTFHIEFVSIGGQSIDFIWIMPSGSRGAVLLITTFEHQNAILKLKCK